VDREDVVRWFRERNDYRDREAAPVPETNDDEPIQKAVLVEYLHGDRVRLKDDPDSPGRVVGIESYPGAVRYEVSWGDRDFSKHYAFELEAIDE
jgi:hypothetical protein